jgi:hypothetical protein
MSSTTSTTTFSSIPQIIIDALDNYTKQTGIDLTTNPFSDKLQLSDFPEWHHETIPGASRGI